MRVGLFKGSIFILSPNPVVRFFDEIKVSRVVDILQIESEKRGREVLHDIVHLALVPNRFSVSENVIRRHFHRYKGVLSVRVSRQVMPGVVENQ